MLENGRFVITKRTSDADAITCYQFNFVVNNTSIRVQRHIIFMVCACVHNGCHNNENNMSDSNTGCPILKVHKWDNMVAREEYLQGF